MTNHRDRKLLNLAHRVQECTNCGRWSEPGCEPAHENGLDSGKGIAIKGQDHRHAALCHDCHTWLDQGSKASPCGWYKGTRADKKEMWLKAHRKTLDIYFLNGWLKVA